MASEQQPVTNVDTFTLSDGVVIHLRTTTTPAAGYPDGPGDWQELRCEDCGVTIHRQFIADAAYAQDPAILARAARPGLAALDAHIMARHAGRLN